MVFSFFLANSVINTLSIIDWFVVSKFRRAFFACNNKQGYPVHQISWTFNSVVATTTGGECDGQWRHRDDITWANDTNDFWWIWYFLDNYRHAWKFSILRIESRSAFINENFSVNGDIKEDTNTKCWSIAPESDSRQIATASEGRTPDAGDSIRNRDTGQVGAVSEGNLPDAGEFTIFTESDAVQAGTRIEGTLPDADDSIRNCDARQTSAAREGPTPDTGEFTIFTKSNARQAGAFPKGPFPDIYDAVRDRYTRQAGAAREDSISDASNTIRNINSN